MLNTCVHHKAKAIYDNWYADIRILGRMNRHAGIARHKTISCTAYVVLHAHGFPKPSDRYLYQVYERINIHIVKY